jgi:ABC-type nitrate/sulfonate/bicarbonate transport system, permease component
MSISSQTAAERLSLAEDPAQDGAEQKEKPSVAASETAIGASVSEVPDEINWKPKSRLWPWLQIASFGAALAVSVAVPAVQDIDPLPYRVFLLLFILFLAIRTVAGLFNKKLGARVNHKAQFYFAIGLLLTLWDILSTKTDILPLPFIPGPAQIIGSAVGDWQLLAISTLYSLRLFIFGFLIGTAVGLVSGILIGWYRQWYYWFFPVLKVIGIVPAVAWIPIAVLIFPSSLLSQIFLIVLSVWFPVAFMAAGGIQNIPKSYFEAAKTLGADESFLIFKIAIPGAMPSIFTGIYTATGLSFTTLVVSEMLGATAGLGYYINWAKGWSIYSKVYAAIAIMAIVFSLILALIFRIRDRVLIWQKGLLK